MQCWDEGHSPVCCEEHKKQVLQLEKWLNKKNIKIKTLNVALREKKQTIEELRRTIAKLETCPHEKKCTCNMPDSWRIGVTCSCFSDDDY